MAGSTANLAGHGWQRGIVAVLEVEPLPGKRRVGPVIERVFKPVEQSQHLLQF